MSDTVAPSRVAAGDTVLAEFPPGRIRLPGGGAAGRVAFHGSDDGQLQSVTVASTEDASGWPGKSTPIYRFEGVEGRFVRVRGESPTGQR